MDFLAADFSSFVYFCAESNEFASGLFRKSNNAAFSFCACAGSCVCGVDVCVCVCVSCVCVVLGTIGDVVKFIGAVSTVIDLCLGGGGGGTDFLFGLLAAELFGFDVSSVLTFSTETFGCCTIEIDGFVVIVDDDDDDDDDDVGTAGVDVG